jgi:replication factor C subunit 1
LKKLNLFIAQLDCPAKMSVSLCGVDTNYEALRSFLSSSGFTVVPWASNINQLVCGDGAGGQWKVAEARRLGIPMVTAASVLLSARQAGELWVNRYAPKRLEDIIGGLAPVNELMGWLRGWTGTVGSVRGALVTGPPGIGKTTAVGLIVAACGYDLVEFNASDERSATAVRRYFDEAKRSGHCGRRRVIVMDEVDGMSTGDRGGIGELARVIATCAFPIICIANERGTPRLRPLAGCCLDIRFQRPTKTVIAKALYTRVVKAEKLSYSVGDLETLCEKNGNDIRSIINALQFSAKSLVGGAKDELQRVDAFSATGRLIGGADSRAVKEELVFLDYGMIPLMVAEGYVAAAGRPRGGVADDSTLLTRCGSAGNYIGDYDILDRRIHSSQTWSLMPHAVSAIVSAATTTQGIAPFQIFPSWLGKQSKRLKHRRWLRDMRMRGVISGSGEGMLDTLDCLRSMLFVKGKSAGEIVGRLVDIGATRDDMLETIVEMTYKDDAGRVALDTKTKGGITREWKKIEASTTLERVKPEVLDDSLDIADSDEEFIDLLD